MATRKRERIIALLEQGTAAREQENLQANAQAHLAIRTLFAPLSERRQGDLEEELATFMAGLSPCTSQEMADALLERYNRRR